MNISEQIYLAKKAFNALKKKEQAGRATSAQVHQAFLHLFELQSKQDLDAAEGQRRALKNLNDRFSK